MARSNYSTTIAIDADRGVFHFYSMAGTDVSTCRHQILPYGGGPLDEAFFQKFKEAVRAFSAETPSESIRKITVVLPDQAVLTDTVKLPTLQGLGQTKKALDVALGGLYRKDHDLQIRAFPAAQNKLHSTFSIWAVQKRILAAVHGACAENQLLVDTLTFASSAAIVGAGILEPKLKNASYLFLDIKDSYSRFVFVANGKVTGYYHLPFGLAFLRKPAVTPEDALFDHTYAALTVLNATERAQARKLTVLNPDGSLPPAENENALPHRNLSPFARRQAPHSREEILQENFRVFVKWALSLLEGNEKLTELAKPEFVCVNLPEELASVLERVNEEAVENGIRFVPLPQKLAVSAHLELFGSLFSKQVSAAGKL